jgi:high affinity sulfate transporter 1
MAADSPIEKQKSGRDIRSFLPILQWLPAYDRKWIRGDIIAAITVWALLVPEAMAYAGIAGVPPEAGLYAAPLALLGYAIFGTSRQLNVGPSSTVAVLSAAIISTFAVAGTQEYIGLTALLAIVTGILLIVAGFLKLGVLADFLSKPVLGGFIIGLAISIAVGQLEKILGYEVEADGYIPDIILIITNIDQTDVLTLIVGLVSLALLFLIDRFIPKLPGAITVLILAIAVSSILDLEALGVHVVGEIPAGLPPLGLPEVISIRTIFRLLPGAVAVALVGFAESVAAARQYATKHGYEVNADQEMIALGVANTGAGLSQGFVVDGSLSKTAASDEAGANSQMVSIIVAAMVIVTVLFLTPLFENLPEATLGAIVIHAVWHLINFAKLRYYRRVKGIDYWAAIVAIVGVLAFGILLGLILAVTLSLLGLLIHAKRPTTAFLGKVPGENVYGDIEEFPDAVTVPGLLIFRFEEQLFFANAPDFRQEIRLAIAADPTIQMVLVDAEAINDLDVTAVDMLSELYDELSKAGVDLRFARMRANVEVYMQRAGLEETIGAGHFYPSVESGVQAFLTEQESNKDMAGTNDGQE